MIWYLLDAFKVEKRERKTNISFKNISKEERKYFIIYFIAIILYFITGVIFPLLGEVHWSSGVSIIVIVVVIIYFTKGMAHISEINYKKNMKEYKKKINNLRVLLKSREFKLYSEKQIIILIEDCNKILPSLKRSQIISKPLIKIFTAIIFPITTLYLGSVMDKFTLNINLQVIAIVIISILYLMGLYYIFSPFARDLLDNDYKNVEKLRDMLSDIILLDFK